MVADAGKILHTATANQHDRVFLEVMSFTRDVRSDLESIRETHARDLTESRIGLLWRRGVHAGADSALLGIGLEGRRFFFLLYVPATLPDELIDCRHSGCLGSR